MYVQQYVGLDLCYSSLMPQNRPDPVRSVARRLYLPLW